MLYVLLDSIIIDDFTCGYMLMTVNALHVFSIIGPDSRTSFRATMTTCRLIYKLVKGKKETKRISMFY